MCTFFHNTQSFLVCWDLSHFLFSADSPEDYTALTQAERHFSPCISQVCVELETINDELVEGDENLFVSLTTGNNWDSRLSLNRTHAQVTIEDDDCE